LDLPAIRDRIDRRVSVQLRLDHVEQLAEPRELHEIMFDHGVHIIKILCEAALDLGQRLGVGIEMMDVDVSVTEDERAALAPTRQRWDEVRRRRERRSMSMVDLRQPSSTAVAPPVRYIRTRPRAMRPSAWASSRMRGASTGGRMLGRAGEAHDPRDECVVATVRVAVGL
jgi:hypothetical protein